MSQRSSPAIQHPVTVDRGLGRFAVQHDHGEHVDQLMRQLLMTAPGERINRPEFGCGIKALLFEPNSELGATLVEVAIRQAVDRWLGSVVRLESVEVAAEGATVRVLVRYVLKVRRERRYLNLEVTR